MRGTKVAVVLLTGAAAAAVAGCVGINLGNSGDAGAAASSAASGSGGDAGDGGGAAQGIDCIVEPTTGATLCSGISLCPGLYVDHDVYPHCGFRPKGNVLDIECACSEEVCPLGVPTTCAQAKQLLDSQTEPQVCTQVAEGRCTPGAPTTAGGTSSTCDRTCSSECGGDPSCLKQCGC